MSGALPVVQALRELGMPLYGCQPPTGYADRADAWVNTGALLNRMNFAVALTEGNAARRRMRACAWPTRRRRGTRLIETALARRSLATSTRATVAKATTAPQAVALVLGSPEFQRR